MGSPGRKGSSVRESIELNPELPPLLVPGRLLNELCQHALETRPEECCGLVAGNGAERFLSVYRCRNEMTMRHRSDPHSHPRDGRAAYFMNLADLLQAREDAESQGQQVTAVYHSHVATGAYFSEMDQEYAEHPLFPFPEAAHIVVAVGDEKVSRVGIFQRDLETGSFNGRAVKAAVQ